MGKLVGQKFSIGDVACRGCNITEMLPILRGNFSGLITSFSVGGGMRLIFQNFMFFLNMLLVLL